MSLEGTTEAPHFERAAFKVARIFAMLAAEKERLMSPVGIGAGRELTVVRVIHAPRARVFKAWIEPKQLAQWWGPKGFTNPLCELDARPGGTMRIEMRAPDGTVYPMDGIIHEIVEPECIVFTTRAFAAATGKTLIEDHNVVTFEELSGRTRLTVFVRVLQVAPEFAEAAAGLEEGWSQSLVRLQDAALP